MELIVEIAGVSRDRLAAKPACCCDGEYASRKIGCLEYMRLWRLEILKAYVISGLSRSAR